MPRQVLPRHVHAPASSRFGFGPRSPHTGLRGLEQQQQYGARALEPVFGLHAAQMMTMNEKNISCYAKKHWVETLHFLGHFFDAGSRAATTGTLRVLVPSTVSGESLSPSHDAVARTPKQT